MNILFEDEYILAAVKPQGMPAQADKTGDPDFLSELEAFAGQPLGLLHRLDRPVGGVMLFAKDKKAEAVLAKERFQAAERLTILRNLHVRLTTSRTAMI